MNRGGSRTAVATMQLEAINYYHKELHLGYCSSPTKVSVEKGKTNRNWVA